MIVKILGFMDFVAALIITLGVFGIVPTSWLWYTAAYIAIKAIIFIGDWMSWIDIISAIIVITLALGLHHWTIWIPISWLSIKTLMSMGG